MIKKTGNKNHCYGCQVFYSSTTHMDFTVTVTVQVC